MDDVSPADLRRAAGAVLATAELDAMQSVRDDNTSTILLDGHMRCWRRGDYGQLGGRTHRVFGTTQIAAQHAGSTTLEK
jgi:hypothetical protein